MTERPILFSAPMVRAILEGGKTQTRRIAKPQPSMPFGGVFSDGRKWWTGDSLTGEVIEILRVPYAVGDRLWVRESFRVFAATMDDCQIEFADGKVRDTGPCTGQIPDAALPGYFRMVDRAREAKTRAVAVSSIHMPRWASRITLGITDVRAQRLHDISEDDAQAEGARPAFTRTAVPDWPVSSVPFFRWGFEELWESIHGPGSWEANPWVAAITFEEVK